jgi:ribulose-phosphate 3-epimerase
MVREAESFASYIQFDIMDGLFVPSRSITDRDLMAIPIKSSWEAHLMVECPEDYLDNFSKAGAKKVIFHYEATSSPQSFISRARGLGLEIGLAINPKTGISDFLQLVDEVNSVLLLTVIPGFYGSKFIPEVLDKVEELRKNRPGLEIGLDGGINKGNIVQVVRSGADVFCVGSAIFLQPKPAAEYYNLVELIEKVTRPD